jgi:uncharacterized protein YllA (UPF0747 family)
VYTILKALTVIKLARALDAMGVPAAPVFWVAAEDHDHQEIESASIINKDSELTELRVDLSNPESMPVGWLALREDTTASVAQCFASLPDSEFKPEVRTLVESAYRPGVSPAAAFLRMLERLFEGTGLVLADPLSAELRRLAEPTLAQAVGRNPALRSAVISRSRALAESGYHEQVKVGDDFTGLFAYVGKTRRPLRPDEVHLDAPLSANVLLRPAVQDAIFPTAAYVGGPAEIAYFAQAAAVYDVLERPVPPVFPRISATVLEPRVERVLQKYGFEFQDMFRGRDFVRRKAVAAVHGVELFDLVRDRVIGELESLRPALDVVDATLAGALDNSKQKVLHQVESLRTKFVNAEARRNETLERHLDLLMTALFPDKKLQERVVNVTTFLTRYGLRFIQLLEAELDLDGREHQVVAI